MIINKVRTTIERHCMLNPDDRVIVAVSGGPDSVALLHILNRIKEEYNLHLRVAHLNHLLRDEAHIEAEFVRELAERLNLDFSYREIDISKLAKDENINIEIAGRKARYTFLSKVAEENEAQKIAMGHTADDQAETVLMRLLRGAGIEGLKGIPPIRGMIIRPLIEINREEILKFLRQNGFEWKIDISNQSSLFLRNRIRCDLLPKIERDYNYRFRDSLLKLAEICREEDTFVSNLAMKKLKSSIIEHNSDGISLDKKKITSLPVVLRKKVFRHILKMMWSGLERIQYAHLEGIENILKNQESSELILPHDTKFIITDGTIYIKSGAHETKTESKYFEYEISNPGEFMIPEINMKIIVSLDRIDDIKLNYNDKNRAFFDADKISFSLIVRGRKPGDRFQPYGMKGSKKIKELMIDEKIPYKRRGAIPIFESKNEIIWIGGIRRAEIARIDKSTQSILSIKIIPR